MTELGENVRTAKQDTWELEEKAPDSQGRWKHIDALDGVRGIAILLVLMDHSLQWLGYTSRLGYQIIAKVTLPGWVGVDLFFVLSGYLITSILLRSKGLDGYYRNFYARRALRIFPAYYFCVIVAVLIVPHLPRRVGDMTGLFRGTKGQAWLWFYCTNIKLTLYHSLYFGSMDPFWSLAVEEHFYFVWPTVVLLLSDRSLRRLCGVLICVAPVLRTWMILHNNEVGAYVFTLCRMDSLAWGAVAASIMHNGLTGAQAFIKGTWVWPLALFAGVALWPGKGTWQLSLEVSAGISLIGFAFCGAVLGAVNRPVPMLKNRMLRSFGKYSYGIYVWENKFTQFFFPALAVTKIGRPIMAFAYVGPLFFSGMSIVASYCAGWLSYNLLEKHFLVLKKYFEYRPVKSRE
jgi:peptidoglycan/LPS O-acetylase OafA/YrhL